jgi:hypothetical protein
MGLPLTADEERSSKLVKCKLFDTLLRPILEGAVREGDLDEVPLNAENLLEMAHALPAKEGAVKPIIARFHAREMRSLVFRHKKRFAPKFEAGPQKDRFKYLIFEDLTRLNFNKMRALAAILGWQPPGLPTDRSVTGSGTTPPSEESEMSLSRLKKSWPNFSLPLLLFFSQRISVLFIKNNFVYRLQLLLSPTFSNVCSALFVSIVITLMFIL